MKTRALPLAMALFAALAFAAPAQSGEAQKHPSPQLGAAWFGDTSGPLIFASDELTDAVQVFSAKTQAEVGLIYGTFPAGLAVDASGNIYVADTGFISGGQRIVEFRPKARQPVRILQDTGFQPVGVDVGPDGTVYVANDCTFVPTVGGCAGSPGNVVGYAPGATSPTETLNPPGMNAPEILAVDSANEIVVAGRTGLVCSSCPPGHQTIGEFDATHSQFTPLSIPKPLAPIHFDNHGHLAMLREGANVLQLFALPSVKPVGEIHLGTPPPDRVASFAFSSDGSQVWTAKMMTSPGFSHEQAMSFAVPNGQQSSAFLIVGTFVNWIAVSPGLQQ